MNDDEKTRSVSCETSNESERPRPTLISFTSNSKDRPGYYLIPFNGVHRRGTHIYVFVGSGPEFCVSVDYKTEYEAVEALDAVMEVLGVADPSYPCICLPEPK